MSFAYVPERDPVLDPPNIADALSESLSNEYGRWIAGTYGTTVSLDGTKVLSRNSSIKIDKGTIQAVGIFIFSSPIDMSKFEKIQFSVAAMASRLNVGSLVLQDTSDRTVGVDFGFTIDQQWNTRTFVKSQFSGFGEFDWSKIASWSFFFNDDTGTYWIDAGPFFYFKVTLPTLIVNAVNQSGSPITGKSIQLTNPQGFSQTYALPMGPVGLSVGEWTLTILDVDFVQWSDGNKNKTRTFIAEYDLNYTFTAVFEAGTLPSAPLDLSNIFLAIGALTFLGGIIFNYTWHR